MHRSLWLEQALARTADDQNSLRGAVTSDVAIVGGGFVGLWTSLMIKRRDAAVDVCIVEADVCGGGASGRNGGFVMTWWPKIASLTTTFGGEESVAAGAGVGGCDR
jgi:glycine/D-amino acid oxidase-like deaminating enzyme